MELVEGETLASRLKGGALEMEQTLRYGSQIADALAAAHAKGIVHRDLKPANVMINKAGAKVLDFGLAKSQNDETATLTNVVMGTPAYMSPEQRAGTGAPTSTRSGWSDRNVDGEAANHGRSRRIFRAHCGTLPGGQPRRPVAGGQRCKGGVEFYAQHAGADRESARQPGATLAMGDCCRGLRYLERSRVADACPPVRTARIPDTVLIYSGWITRRRRARAFSGWPLSGREPA
jgi:hypothetical protein